MTTTRIGVIGAGAWGTALAQVAARSQASAAIDVLLWTRDQQQADRINQSHNNEQKLPGVLLDSKVMATAEIAAMARCDIVLLATPAQTARAVLASFASVIGPGTKIVITAKGIERGSAAFMTSVLRDACPQAVPLVLSGPGFADDVVRGLPTAVTLAASTIEIARPVAEALSLPTFRLYLSDDLTGVQLGGAMKNVLAIASGMVAGRRLGESARAALIARAFAEMTRLGRALGGKAETLAGLSGLGDLVLSCSSEQSRNFRLGRSLGEGRLLGDILGSQRGTSEGVYTAVGIVGIASRRTIEVPVSSAVHDILDGRCTIDQAIDNLLQRPVKSEI